MNTETDQDILEIDGPPFVKGIIPGTMSGAEMLAYWRENGVFDVPWPQFDDIGPGKKYAYSTEYVIAMRKQSEQHFGK